MYYLILVLISLVIYTLIAPTLIVFGLSLWGIVLPFWRVTVSLWLFVLVKGMLTTSDKVTKNGV